MGRIEQSGTGPANGRRRLSPLTRAIAALAATGSVSLALILGGTVSHAYTAASSAQSQMAEQKPLKPGIGAPRTTTSENSARDLELPAAATPEDEPSPEAAAPPPGHALLARKSVLVTVSISAPKSLDDEIGRDHGITIIDRLSIAALDSRVIRYRIPDGRSLEDVMAALRTDKRVGSFQANLTHEALREPPVEDESQRVAKNIKDPPIQQIGRPREPKLPPAARAQAQIDAPVQSKPRQRTADQLVFADTSQMAASRENSKSRASRSSGTTGGSRWPSPDEPFVDIGPTRF